ncbi:MAG: AAA family ATPase [Deltaproteobacteria bacterium]|nr:AAA family ATPase [Deltaproteobacteria bacterium]
MILKSITVQGWRCFLNPVTVGPLDPALNILFAPNACGKTTLFEALRRALLDNHRVGGKDIEAVKPWGRDLAPTVQVLFENRGERLRITKRFLDQPFSKLEREEEGRMVPLAEGPAADERVRAVLTRSAPVKGLARPEHWGLAQVLWAPQGDLSLVPFSGEVLADIRATLGAQVGSVGPVEKLILDRYTQFFTPTGKLRGGEKAPRIIQLQAALEKALVARATALKGHEAFEDLSRKVRDLQLKSRQALYEAEEIKKLLAAQQDRADTYKAAQSELKEREARCQALKSRYGQLSQQREGIRSTQAELQAAGDDLEKSNRELPLQQREAEALQRIAHQAKARLEDARLGRKKVDQARETADDASVFLNQKHQSAELTSRLEKIKETHRALLAVKEERGRLVAPTARELSALRKAVSEKNEARLRLENALITLEIVPEIEGTAEVLTGEQTGSLPLRSGVPAFIQGSPEVAVSLPGIARIRARGPAGSIEELRKNLERAGEKIRKLLEPYGGVPVEELEKREERARDLEARLMEQRTRLETLLAGEAFEALQSRLALVETRMMTLLENYPDWETKPPDGERQQLEARTIKERFVQEVEKAEGEWEKAQISLSAATSRISTLESERTRNQNLVQTLEKKLATLGQEAGDEKTLADEMARTGLEFEGATAGLEEVKKRLAGYDEDPLQILERLQKRLEAAWETSRQALGAEKGTEGELRNAGSQGAYSILVRAEEETAKLERELAAETRQVQAVRLLFDTLNECRSKMAEALTAPVEHKATYILQRIAGRRPGPIRLNQGLDTPAINLEPSAPGIPIDQVSGGEREQIYLATRLALAELLAARDRQLVVLDDVLTFTDAARMARVLDVLEESARRLQILIITCHPERYRGFATARFIDLEEMVRAAA